MINREGLYFVLDKVLNESEILLEQQTKTLANTSESSKSNYIQRSNPYCLQQIKSRLEIINSFDISIMNDNALYDLYEVRTWIAGIYSTLYGFEKNLDKGMLLVNVYEIYLSDVLEAIRDIKSNLHHTNLERN